MSTDYQRGYNKGYSTGCRRGDPQIAEARKQAKDAAERAEHAERAQGIGHCVDCRHWLRGGGGSRAESCAWGHCKAGRQAGTPWGTWALPDGAHTGVEIVTTPNFGCVLFGATD